MLWGAEEFMIFFVWNDFFGIHRLRDSMQDINEIPKFMCKEPEFKPETLSTGDRMYVSSFSFYYNDGRRYKHYDMPKFWVTDRINNLFMLCIDEHVYEKEAGNRFYALDTDRFTDPMEYWLIVNNQPVRIAASFEYTGDKNQGYQVSWDIAKVIVPSALYYISENQMQNIIKKAFEAYAYILLAQRED